MEKNYIIGASLLIVAILFLVVYIRYHSKKGEEKMANEEVKSRKFTFLNHNPLL